MNDSTPSLGIGVSKDDIVYAPIIIAIPAFIYFIQFFAPEVIQQAFLFQFPSPHPASIWGASYMHAKDAWAIANIRSFLAIVTFAYLIYASMDEHKTFTHLIIITAVIGPFVYAIAGMASGTLLFGGMPSGVIATGSSAIVASMYGVLFFGTYEIATRRYDRTHAFILLGLVLTFSLKGMNVSRDWGISTVVFLAAHIMFIVLLVPREWVNNTISGVRNTLTQNYWIIVVIGSSMYIFQRYGNALTPAFENQFREISMLIVHGTGFAFGVALSFIVINGVLSRFYNQITN